MLYYNTIKRANEIIFMFCVSFPHAVPLPLHDALLRTTIVCFIMRATFIFQRTPVFHRPLFRYHFAAVLSSANIVSNIPRSLLHVRYDSIRLQPFLFLCTTLLVFQCTAVFLGLLFRMLSVRLISQRAYPNVPSPVSCTLLRNSICSTSYRNSLLLFSVVSSTCVIPWVFFRYCSFHSRPYSWGPRWLSLRIVTADSVLPD